MVVGMDERRHGKREDEPRAEQAHPTKRRRCPTDGEPAAHEQNEGPCRCLAEPRRRPRCQPRRTRRSRRSPGQCARPTGLRGGRLGKREDNRAPDDSAKPMRPTATARGLAGHPRPAQVVCWGRISFDSTRLVNTPRGPLMFQSKTWCGPEGSRSSPLRGRSDARTTTVQDARCPPAAQRRPAAPRRLALASPSCSPR